LVEGVKGLKEILSEEQFKKQAELQIYIIGKISDHISCIRSLTQEMIDKRKHANALEEAHEKSNYYCDKVKPYFDSIRYHVDKLEVLVDDEMWTLPKYREMLFVK
jgi:glutamine synthetase